MAFHKEQDVIQLCLERLKTIYGQSVRLINSRSVGGGCINHSVKINTSAGDLYHILNHHLLFGGSYGRQALEIAKAFV